MHIVAKRYRGAAAAESAPGEDAPGEDEPGEGEPEEGDPSPPRGFFLGWVRVVTKVPILTVLVIVALLGLATLPAAHLRLALPDAGSLEEGEPGRISYDLVAEHFGPGFNGPLIVTGSIIQSTDPVGLMDDLGQQIASLPGVAAVPLSTPNESGDTGIVQVIPEGGPDSTKTKALVAELRSMHDEFEEDYGADLSVTGYTAAGIDISARLADALLPFALLVVGLSLILLAMVFRSIVVPITAALGYLLSVGAAFGIGTLVFVDGFLAGPLNVAALGSVISFMPIILMGVLFGLAMDYEVFLVSRMREDFVHVGNARHAVITGFVGSARVVTAAAIIMFAVFAAFIPSGDASIQPIALGLAVGVAIDAFVVRMSFIPAVLMLFGRWAWWIPRWLDRILPSFDVEGEGLQKELDVADWPEPGDRLAIAAEGVTVADASGSIVQDLELFVPAGDVLLVRGEPGSGRTALLLALAGRLPIRSGRLKVAGFALPMRSSSVRSTSGIAFLARSPDPVDAVRRAVAKRASLVLLDDLDAVTRPSARRAIAGVLGDAARDAGRRGSSLTIVASCAMGSDVDGLFPADSTIRLHALADTVLIPALVMN
jgi:RND superfamily putative drug exporter